MSGSDSNPSHVSYPSEDSPNLSDSGSSSKTPKNISNQNVPSEGTSSKSPPLRSLVRVIPEEVVNIETKRSSLVTDLKPVKLKAIESKKLEEKSLYFFNPLIPFRIPKNHERLDSFSKTTIALSVEAFRYASCFPVPLIIEQLCVHFDLSPSQLMPHVWRVALVADILGRRLGVPLDLLDVLTSYSISEVKASSGEVRAGIYTLIRNRKGLETWTSDKGPNDRQWDERFLIIPIASLETPGVKLRKEWRRLSKTTNLIPYL